MYLPPSFDNYQLMGNLVSLGGAGINWEIGIDFFF